MDTITEAPATITDTQGRIWTRQPSVIAPVPGILNATYTCGKRKATLFRGRGQSRARFITVSGKRLEVEA